MQEQFKVQLVAKLKPKAAPQAETTAATPQSVLLSIVFSDGLFGSDEEQAIVAELKSEMESACSAALCGTLMGDDVMPNEIGKVFIGITGEDADLIWAAIADLLEKRTFQPGSTATKKYADREEQVDLTLLT
ncbi:MAG: hypothetical protein K2W85_09325 [Phycisphaerales bacterium]|nr:hypothetical protein [Phycisphaerales bacterium]